MKQPRQLVAEALIRLEREKSWSNLALDRLLETNNLQSRDSAFASALFYGVLERMYTLDACIAAHSRMPLKKLSPQVLAVLRCALCQLLYMDGVPDSAAVHESVELVKKLRQPGAAGFVNGVLRSFLRAEKRIPLPDAPPEARLAVEYSCPPEMVKLWLEGYGDEPARRILAASLARPPHYLRVNTRRTDAEELLRSLRSAGFSAERDDLLPDCLAVTGGGALHKTELYRQGLFHLQDKSSQLCAAVAAPPPGGRVLDACAAPGGKSLTMAQLMEDRGEVVSCELHPHRAAMIAERAAGMGLGCIRALCADMTQPQPELGRFDSVLCDVPCSGYGVIRRKPEIKYKPLGEFEEIPITQYKILENSANYCKAGGLLVYSTCTLHPAENEGVAERFLLSRKDFVPAPLGGVLGEGWNRTLLDEFGADGFFIAAFRRAADPSMHPDTVQA